MHFVENGKAERGTCVLCHGWPEIWYSWKDQIDPIASLGFRVIVPDQRGFGFTSSPTDKSQYTMEKLTADLVALLDYLNIPKAIFIGHDWGSIVAWSLSVHHTNRVAAVSSVVVPFYPVNPSKNPWIEMQKNAGLFDYQMYFNEEGKPERELSRDLEYTFKCLLRSAKTQDRLKYERQVSFANVRERGGMLVGFPTVVNTSCMFTEEDLAIFVEAYANSGFRGGLNWYRNIEENWKWNKKVAGKKVEVPALMVTVGKDKLFRPDMIQHLENWIPNLTKGHVEESGHWLEEEPLKLKEILTKWLDNLPSSIWIVNAKL